MPDDRYDPLRRQALLAGLVSAWTRLVATESAADREIREARTEVEAYERELAYWDGLLKETGQDG